MALPTLATTAELATWMGRTAYDATGESSEGRATALLEAASTLVRKHCGLTWVEGAAGSETLITGIPDVVEQVTKAAAARAFLNPKGIVQETAGPFSHTLQTDSGDVYLKSAEMSALNAEFGLTGGGLAVLTQTRDDGLVHAPGGLVDPWELTAW